MAAFKCSLSAGRTLPLGRSSVEHDKNISTYFAACQKSLLSDCSGCRSERLAKYNQLLRIEEELGENAVYAGDNWRHIGW